MPETTYEKRSSFQVYSPFLRFNEELMPRASIVIHCCFFVTGFSALLFEIVAMRRLSIAFGVSHIATISVLMAYMAGLGLGGWCIGKFSDKWKKPLRAYAILEGCLVPYFIFFPFISALAAALFNNICGSDPGTAGALNLRILLALIILLPPTFLMGATLPVLSSWFAGLGKVGEKVGKLYAINTTGAMLGALAGGTFLIPLLTEQGTFFVAAVCNFSAAIAAFSIRNCKAEKPAAEKAKEPEETKTALELGKEKQFRTQALLLALVSGLASMTVQVAFHRLLGQLIGQSVYSFSLITTFSIGSIALGAWLARFFLNRTEDKVRLSRIAGWAAVMAIGATTLVLFFLPVIANLSFTVHELIYKAPEETRIAKMLLFRAGLAAFITLPPGLFLGMSLPLAIGIFTRSDKKTGKDVGRIYLINTIGALVGTFIAGVYLLPGTGYGIVTALSFVVFCLVLIAILLKQKSVGIPATLMIVVGIFAMSAFIAKAARPKLALAGYLYSKDYTEKQIIHEYVDGISCTVAILQNGPDGEYAMTLNGKLDSSAHPIFLQTQYMGGTLPVLINDSPEKDIMIVGYGSGATTGNVLGWGEKEVKSVTALELEPEVVRLSDKYFYEINNLPGENERFKLVFNDARNFFSTTKSKYDIVISIPSNPWVAACAPLFTKEALESGKKILKKDGTWCQWIHFYGMSIKEIQVFFKTFLSVYPHALVFGKPGDTARDLIIIGSDKPIRLDNDRIKKLLKSGEPSAKLLKDKIGVTEPAQILARYITDEKGMKAFLELDKTIAKSDIKWDGPTGFFKTFDSIPINTDNNGYIEFHAPFSLFLPEAKDIYKALRICGRPVTEHLDEKLEPEQRFKLYTNIFEQALSGWFMACADQMRLKLERLAGRLDDKTLVNRELLAKYHYLQTYYAIRENLAIDLKNRKDQEAAINEPFPIEYILE